MGSFRLILIIWEAVIMLTQNDAPIYDALMKYKDARVVPFDVP